MRRPSTRAAPTASAGGSTRASGTAGSDWAVGDRILDLYEVREIHRDGGMGLVYRVRHLGWDVDLAVKSPRPEFLRSEADRKLFVQEAETWVSLEMHPHVCGCYYVRTIDGVPRVFGEYVEAGSLRDWIGDRRLYEGTRQEVLARVLDVGIQVAWGLEHAHAHGVVHQDVKPANVLLEADGTAKVTDFGLAKGVPTGAGQGLPRLGNATALVSVGGMTPAYASPEQAAGRGVRRRTDVFSFAVSVLEMFAGEVTWLAGAAAAEALDALVEAGDGPVNVPPSVARLLAECLNKDPARRPKSMAEVARKLTHTYERAIGRQFGRRVPKAVELRADQLNNRALSLVDLGRAAEAEQCFADARASDPQHVQAIYNGGLLRWRAGRMADEALVAELGTAVAGIGRPAWALHLLAQVHLERADTGSALPLLEEAARQDPRARKDLNRARADTAWHEGGLRMFTGKNEGIMSLDLTDDGNLAVTGCMDKTVRVWDLRTGKCVRTLKGHKDWIGSVGVSGNGQRAVSAGGEDRAVRVWDLRTGRCTRVFRDHSGSVTSVGMDAAGFRAVSGSSDGSVRVVTLREGSSREIYRDHLRFGSPVVISADGKVILTADKNDNIYLHHPVSTRPPMKGHTGSVSALAVSPDGSRALSAGADGKMHLWDVRKRDCLRTLECHEDQVRWVDLSSDGRLALACGTNGTVRLWDLESGRSLRAPTGDEPGAAVSSARFTSDGLFAVYGGGIDRGRGAIWVWELPKRYLSSSYAAPFHLCRPRRHDEVTRLDAEVDRLVRQGRQAIASGRFPEALELLTRVRATPGHERARSVRKAWQELASYSVREGIRAVWPVEPPLELARNVRALCVSANGHWALSTADNDGTIRKWELPAGRSLSLPKWRYSRYWKAVSDDGGFALTMSRHQHALEAWDLLSGELLGELKGHTDHVSSICISSDDRLVLTASQDKTVRVWSLPSGRCIQTLKGHRKGVTSLCLSRAEPFALSGSWDGTVKVWDLQAEGGRCVRTLTPSLRHRRTGVESVALSTDGQVAVSGHADGALRMWELATGRCVRTLTGHTRGVSSISLGAEGRFALTGGRDSTVRFWDLESGRCLQTLDVGVGSLINEVRLTPDGRAALCWGFDNIVRQWEIDWELQARDQADWDEAARPFLERFLYWHPLSTATDADFEELFRHLRYGGYGWLRPESVKAQLERMARHRKSSPPIPGSMGA